MINKIQKFTFLVWKLNKSFTKLYTIISTKILKPLNDKYDIQNKAYFAAEIIQASVISFIKNLDHLTSLLFRSVIGKIIIPSIVYIFPKSINIVNNLSYIFSYFPGIFTTVRRLYNIYKPIQNLVQNFVTSSVKLTIKNLFLPLVVFIFPNSKNFIETLSSSLFNANSQEVSKIASLLSQTFTFYKDSITEFSTMFVEKIDEIDKSNSLSNEFKFKYIILEVKNFLNNILHGQRISKPSNNDQITYNIDNIEIRPKVNEVLSDCTIKQNFPSDPSNSFISTIASLQQKTFQELLDKLIERSVPNKPLGKSL
ncbi:MAG: hypothetical protein ACK4OM_00630 [Alphaproteobacteria bacterium]